MGGQTIIGYTVAPQEIAFGRTASQSVSITRSLDRPSCGLHGYTSGLVDQRNKKVRLGKVGGVGVGVSLVSMRYIVVIFSWHRVRM